jgi:3-oxoacyl-(acyl-carrier-protein) synthase
MDGEGGGYRVLEQYRTHEANGVMIMMNIAVAPPLDYRQ